MGNLHQSQFFQQIDGREGNKIIAHLHQIATVNSDNPNRKGEREEERGI